MPIATRFATRFAKPIATRFAKPIAKPIAQPIANPMARHVFIPLLLTLTACSSPPKPQTVDPASRHPVNASAAVELQTCRNELHNTRILAAESNQVAESTAATLTYVVAQQRALLVPHETATLTPLPPPPRLAGNSVYVLHFDFGSSRVEIPAPAAQTLIARAKLAPLVMLRGRTDGARDSLAESRIARERASAVRGYLIARGVDPARIRATFQPVGDPAADNGTPGGRGLNRRVEIEIYQALPVPLDIEAASS